MPSPVSSVAQDSFRTVPEVGSPERFELQNPIADHYAEYGYNAFAALVEAGYACSACHLTHQLNRIPRDDELDLERFDRVAWGARGARLGVEIFAAGYMGAWASFEARLSQISSKITIRNAIDPLDDITVKQVGEAILSDPVARRAYAQLQAHGTEVVLEFGAPELGAATFGEANRRLNRVTVFVRMHRSASEVVSTLVHESSHVHRHFRGGRATQADELRAFAREFLYDNKRRPTLAERATLRAQVARDYSHLPTVAP